MVMSLTERASSRSRSAPRGKRRNLDLARAAEGRTRARDRDPSKRPDDRTGEEQRQKHDSVAHDTKRERQEAALLAHRPSEGAIIVCDEQRAEPATARRRRRRRNSEPLASRSAGARRARFATSSKRRRGRPRFCKLLSLSCPTTALNPGRSRERHPWSSAAFDDSEAGGRAVTRAVERQANVGRVKADAAVVPPRQLASNCSRAWRRRRGGRSRPLPLPRSPAKALLLKAVAKLSRNRIASSTQRQDEDVHARMRVPTASRAPHQRQD